MNKQSILKDIAEVNILKKEVNEKQKIVNNKAKEVKNNFEIFLADQNIDLTERYSVWIQAPKEMLGFKSLDIPNKKDKELSEIIKAFLWILAEFGFNYDDDINLVQETETHFWDEFNLKLTDQNEVFYNYEEEIGKSAQQMVEEFINYIVSNNIGFSVQSESI